MAANLACCHACQMIGSEADATAHRIATGYEIEVLDAETSAGVRAEWDNGTAERVTAYRTLARFMGRSLHPDPPGRT